MLLARSPGVTGLARARLNGSSGLTWGHHTAAVTGSLGALLRPRLGQLILPVWDTVSPRPHRRAGGCSAPRPSAQGPGRTAAQRPAERSQRIRAVSARVGRRDTPHLLTVHNQKLPDAHGVSWWPCRPGQTGSASASGGAGGPGWRPPPSLRTCGSWTGAPPTGVRAASLTERELRPPEGQRAPGGGAGSSAGWHRVLLPGGLPRSRPEVTPSSRPLPQDTGVWWTGTGRCSGGRSTTTGDTAAGRWPFGECVATRPVPPRRPETWEQPGLGCASVLPPSVTGTGCVQRNPPQEHALAGRGAGAAGLDVRPPELQATSSGQARWNVRVLPKPCTRRRPWHSRRSGHLLGAGPAAAGGPG